MSLYYLCTKHKRLNSVSHCSAETYLSARYIKEHMAKFENGAIRIISREKLNKYGTLGPDGGFVFSNDYLDDVVKEAKGKHESNRTEVRARIWLLE